MIVGIAGCTVDLVIALKVAQHDGYIGFSEHHGAGAFQTLYNHGVFLGNVVFPGRITPGGGRARDVVGLLNGHGYPVQRAPVFPTGQRGIGRISPRPGPVADLEDDGVDGRVQPINPFQVVFQEFAAGDLFLLDFGRQLDGGQERQLAHSVSRVGLREPGLCNRRVI